MPVAALCSAALLLVAAAVAGRDLWFFSDDWNIYADYHDGNLLTPFNGHLSLVPAGIYRVLFHTAGMGSYLPYRMSAVDDPELQAAWTDTLSGRWLAIAYDELLNGVDPDNPGPLIGPYDEFREILRGQIEELIYNGATPEQVTTTANQETTEAIVAYNDEGL